MTPALLAARWRAVWQDEKQRVRLLLTVGLAGMLLLGISEWLPASGQEALQDTEAAVPAEDYERELETRLAALIGAMDGAGDTAVMVTLESGEETVYAAESQTDTSTGADTSSRSEQTSPALAGSSQPLVERREMPQVRGVAVVCRGGADPAVQRKITEMVCALTGVGANRVTVNAMQP